MLFLTAFVTGLLSSFHCVGMCGPIALATPNVGTRNGHIMFGKLLYHTGRVVTYAILGALVGLIGVSLQIIGVQQSISIISGSLVVLGGVFSFSKLEQLLSGGFRLVNHSFIGRLFKTPTYPSLFLIGLINGLLPCGLVYVALLGAVSTQSMVDGAIFMAFYGMGTLPLMMLVNVLGQFLSPVLRNRIRKILPLLIILVGLLLIMRGLNLGIPYISPNLEGPAATPSHCGDSVYAPLNN